MIKSKKDMGIIHIPMLSPHLELFTFSKAEFGVSDEMLKKNPESVNQINFTFVINSKGQGHHLAGLHMRDILRLVDGKRTRYEIAATLKDKYQESDTNILISNLAYNYVIMSAESNIPRGQAAIWGQLGVTPCYYEEFVATLKIHCMHLNNRPSHVNYLTEALDNMYIPTADNMSDADLLIVAIDDYMQPELMTFNQNRLKDKKRWMPVKLSDAEMMYGPIFTPEKDGVCLHCITNNMRNNREMRGFLEYNKPGSLSAKVEADTPLLSKSHAVHILFTIIKSLILGDEKNADYLKTPSGEYYHKLLTNYLFAHDVLTSNLTTHFANKRPQCLSCGDPVLNDQNRKLQPVNLVKDDGHSVFTSGGMKAVSSEQTLKKYAHLVSPITGVISAIESASPSDDDWMHVYWSGSNLAIINRNFRALTNSIRSKSAGKGRSDNQARVSAMCEALERYSGVFNGNEIRKIAKFSDFPKGDALHPNDIMLFSKNQYKLREEIAAKEYRFYNLPAEDFDENAEVEWSPVWSITQKKYIWMMCYQLYFSYDPATFYGPGKGDKLNRNFANPDSNGAASGNTPAEAFVQGFMELVERDAYAIWWYNRVFYPEVDLASFNDPYLDMAVLRYREKYKRKLWVLDISNDLGIPTFVAISYRFDKKKQDICISAGSHFDPHIATLRAVCELNQYVSAVLKSTDDENSYTYFDRECNEWWQNATLESDPYLLPDPNAKKITKSSYPLIKRNLNEEVQACIDIAHLKGLEVLVLEQTKPDVGLPVIKVMVPGMRHFWARFAPGRLFDVPVEMGKLSKPLKEEDLNPIPVFI